MTDHGRIMLAHNAFESSSKRSHVGLFRRQIYVRVQYAPGM